MKAKVISKVLKAKFQDWANSIKDENVRNLVNENTIITGGAIASMLLKEPVNDFDIYFTDKKTTKAVAKYYASLFKYADVKVLDGDDCDKDNIGELEKGRIKMYIPSYGIASEEGEGKTIDGSDFSDDDSENIIIESDDKKEKYRPIFISANAITLSDKIQIVIRFYGDPETIHQHYDYLHCTNYWLSKTGELHLKQNALKCLLAKELVYVGSKYPICSVIRTRKFIKRGWTINAGQYLKMCFQISNLDLTDIRVLEEQLTGVDAAYFGILIDALNKHTKENPSFELGYDYLSTIIDKIF